MHQNLDNSENLSNYHKLFDRRRKGACVGTREFMLPLSG